MAMFDIIGEMSDAQDFTITTTETIVSEDVINLGTSGVNWGNAEIWLNIKVHTAFTTSGGTPSTTITLRSSADSTVNASDTAVITVAAQNLTTATSIGSDILRQRLPVTVDVNQYLGVVAVNTGGGYAAGKLDIWLDHGPQSDFGTQKTQSNIT